MKDCTQKELESSRPDISAQDALEFCLERLYLDKRHYITQEIVDGLDFEELIGTLLLARDVVIKNG